jgi:hypothetical protein
MNNLLPETLYHATFPDSVDAILMSGLQENQEGVVNLANSPVYAAGFVSIRDFSRLGEITIVEMDGIPTPNIDRQRFDVAQVLAINARRLDPEKLEINHDEVRASAMGALPSDLVTYRYKGSIPREAIHIADTFHRNDSRIPPHFAP